MGLFPPKQNEIGYIYFLILVRFDISLMLFNDISSRPDIRLHYCTRQHCVRGSADINWRGLELDLIRSLSGIRKQLHQHHRRYRDNIAQLNLGGLGINNNKVTTTTWSMSNNHL